MHHRTAGRSVFVATSRGTLPGTAALPTCQVVQELFCSPQATTNNPHSEDLTSKGTSTPFNENKLLQNIDDSLSDLLIEIATVNYVLVKS